MDSQSPIIAAVQKAVGSAGMACELDGDLIHVERSSAVLAVSFELIDDRRALPVIRCRTTSWHFAGERSDLHDVISTMFAVYVRARGAGCCAMVDETNPAIPCEHEIYGRYLLPMQPWGPFVSHEQAADLGVLLASLNIFEMIVCEWLAPQDSSPEHPEPRFSFTEDGELGQRTRKATRQSAADALEYRREAPTWDYFHTARSGLTTVRCEPFAQWVMGMAEEVDGGPHFLSEGLFFDDGVFHNFIDRPALSRIRALLSGLERTRLTNEDFAIVPLEDRVVAACGEHVVSIRADCGRAGFARARAAAVDRHRSEVGLLFRSQRFSWVRGASAGRFEDLVGELLFAAGKVSWIRSAGPTHSPDGGRDLIAEWVEPAQGSVPEGVSPISKTLMVVQCKHRFRTVNKEDVQDIRDTIERHRAGGYFLAVSNNLSKPLVDVLITLRDRPDTFAEWWARKDIEDQLRQHPDIASRYRDVVTALPLDDFESESGDEQ